jgi:hypothetical protein
VSLVQLAYDLIGITTPIGHGGGNQDLDVIRPVPTLMN